MLIPGTPTQRAQALLDPLQRLTPCDAVFITAFDPERRIQTPLLRHGYPCIGVPGPGRPPVHSGHRPRRPAPRPPTRVIDLHVPPDTLPTWSQVMYPAGIREGIAAVLFTRDGRYLGVVSTSSADPRPADEDARDLLDHARPWIAHAIDPLRTVNAIAGLVSDAVAGVAITRAANALPLTGLPGHALLAPGAPLTIAAVTHPGSRERPHRLPRLGPYLRPRSRPLPGEHPRLPSGAPRPSQPGDPVVPGPVPERPHPHRTPDPRPVGDHWPPARIAASTGATDLAAHLASITTKLNVASHLAAVALARRRGIYIPAGPAPA